MERIQAAIEKARAERQTQQPAPVSAAEAQLQPAAAPAPTEDAAIAARWAGLSQSAADPAKLVRSRIVTAAGGPDAVAFDVMRTKTLQQMRANGWKRLAITSPTPGCGKSTLTLNLGFGLARQTELRIVVAELDLRRPALVQMLGQEPTVSFSEMLGGKAGFSDIAMRQGTNLALAINRSPVRNPAELLHGASVAAALEAIERDYRPDILIFDMPPMLVSDDAMAVMGQMDCVLLVAAADATKIKEIDVCEREAATQTTVMGVVLNKCRYMGPDYGYSYYG